MKIIVKFMLSVFTILIYSAVSNSAEIETCEFQDAQNAAYLENDVFQGDGYGESSFSIADFENNGIVVLTLSKKSCDLLGFVNKKTEILSITLGAVAGLCVAVPVPQVQAAGALIGIAGFGFSIVNLTFKGDFQTCEKQEREAEVRELLRNYLEKKGAIVTDGKH